MPTEGSGDPAAAELIMKIDLPPDALEPGFHCVLVFRSFGVAGVRG
jgi:hypothetical protein